MPAPPRPHPFYAPDQLNTGDNVAYWMRQVLHSIRTQMDARVSDLGVTYAQWMPLYKLLSHDDCTVAQMARQLGVDPAAMTRTFDRLETKGFVVRHRSTTDRRVVHVRLTETGRAVANRVPPVLADTLNQHLAGFSHDEWQGLMQLLRRMLENGTAAAASEPS